MSETPLYTLPGRYNAGGRWLLLLVIVLASQVLAHTIASSWAAVEMARLAGGWFRELGEPLGVVAGHPVMAPHAWWGWDALRKVPAFAGVFLHLNWAYAAILIVFPAKWMLAQPVHAEADVHGSARWAVRRDIEKTGLLGE